MHHPHDHYFHKCHSQHNVIVSWGGGVNDNICIFLVLYNSTYDTVRARHASHKNDVTLLAINMFIDTVATMNVNNT